MPTAELSASLHEDAGFLASNLTQETTGIDGAVIWMFSGEPTRSASPLGPRILVTVGEVLMIESLAHAVAVRLSPRPEVVGALPPGVMVKAVEFAQVNRDVLLRYWSGEMSTRSALDLLERV
jgi:hypothetical protein